MKILSEKEQLSLRLSELNDSIQFTSDNEDKIYNKIQRKDAWGVFSFVFEPYWYLMFERKNILYQLNLLKVYREILIERINK